MRCHTLLRDLTVPPRGGYGREDESCETPLEHIIEGFPPPPHQTLEQKGGRESVNGSASYLCSRERAWSQIPRGGFRPRSARPTTRCCMRRSTLTLLTTARMGKADHKVGRAVSLLR